MPAKSKGEKISDLVSPETSNLKPQTCFYYLCSTFSTPESPETSF
jgi:hypothetical protein